MSEAETDRDERVTCTACRHYRAGYCTNARRAQLTHHNGRAEVGRTLAETPQHCNGYEGKK